MHWSQVRLAAECRIDRRNILVSPALAAPFLSSLVRPLEGATQHGHGFGSSGSPTGTAALRAFLGMLPSRLFDEQQETGLVWTFADVATQMASLGIDMPADGFDIPDGFLNAQFPLIVNADVYSYALLEDFVDALGFPPLSVHTSLSAGMPPARISMFRGGFATSGLPAAWESVEYTASDGPGGTPYWTIREPGGADFDHPIQGKTFSALDHLAIVGDTVIGCGSEELLLEILTVIAGDAPSLAQHEPTVAALEGLPENLVSAAGLNAAFLEVRPDDPVELLAESDDAAGPMPPLVSVVLGVTPGLAVVDPDAARPAATPDIANGEGLIHVQLLAGSPDDATQAATVSEFRWTTGTSLMTGEPLSELMPLQSATANGNVAHLVFANPRTPRAWYQMIVTRDLYPYLWG